MFQTQVAEAEKSMRMAQKDLADTKERLAELNRQLAALRDQFSTKTAEQLDLKAKAEVGDGRGLAVARVTLLIATVCLCVRVYAFMCACTRTRTCTRTCLCGVRVYVHVWPIYMHACTLVCTGLDCSQGTEANVMPAACLAIFLRVAEHQHTLALSQVMERRLNAAERLIAGLGSERTRWGNDVQGLGVAHEKLVGDCLLCASFLSYCGEDLRCCAHRCMRLVRMSRNQVTPG